MDVLNNPAVNAAVQVLQQAISLIRERFSEDAEEHVIKGVQSAFIQMNLAGEMITAEGILGRYQRQRATSSH